MSKYFDDTELEDFIRTTVREYVQAALDERFPQEEPEPKYVDFEPGHVLKGDDFDKVDPEKYVVEVWGENNLFSKNEGDSKVGKRANGGKHYRVNGYSCNTDDLKRISDKGYFDYIYAGDYYLLPGEEIPTLDDLKNVPAGHEVKLSNGWHGVMLDNGNFSCSKGIFGDTFDPYEGDLDLMFTPSKIFNCKTYDRDRFTVTYVGPYKRNG